MSAELATQRPFLVRPGDRNPMWSLGGHFTNKLTRDDGDGAFSLTEAVAFRSTEPPLHVHQREDEAWYVLEGQMTFHVDFEPFWISRRSEFRLKRKEGGWRA